MLRTPRRLSMLVIPAAMVLAAAVAGPAGAAPVDIAVPTAVATPVASVNLRSAAGFAILSASGVTDVYASAITGDVGTSPITGAAIGVRCSEVTGMIYAVDAAGPACAVKSPSMLTTAVSDLELAYADAAGRILPTEVNLGAGEIGGLTIEPGLYSWTTDLKLSGDVILTGGPDDVFIFQVAGNIVQASAKNVTLAGGAQAKNVFWQSAKQVSIGTTAHLEGTVLAKTLIAMKTGASINGRLLAQTAVTLQKNTVVLPAK